MRARVGALGHVLANVLEPCGTSRAGQRVNVLCRHDRLRAAQTDEIRELLDRVEELVEIDRTCEFNVSEVTRTGLVCLFACGAHLAVLNHTEACVEHAIRYGLVALIGLIGRNLDDAPLADVLRVRDAELNAYDRVAHSVPAYLYVYISSVLALS